MPANRKDTVTVNGESHQIIYNHQNNSATLKGATTTFVLEEVTGQYVLETPQRRDLVINELLSLDEKGAELKTEDLLGYGFRQQ